MTPDLFAALLVFAFVSVMTPGPNNLMLMASGANFGLRRTLPHMAGVALGFPGMIVLVGLGVMQLFALWPPLQTILTAVSVAYLLFLAWKIANAAPPDEAQATGRPLTFLQAAAFQWVNPKAWSMALGAITLYAASREVGAVLWVAGTYVAMGCVSTSTWALIGTQIRRLLAVPGRLRVFNIAMALALVGSVALPLVM